MNAEDLTCSLCLGSVLYFVMGLSLRDITSVRFKYDGTHSDQKFFDCELDCLSVWVFRRRAIEGKSFIPNQNKCHHI